MTPTERMEVRTAKYWLMAAVKTCLGDLLAEDEIRVAQRIAAFPR